MSSSGNGSDLSSLMTFGVAAPGEALTSSESPAASPEGSGSSGWFDSYT